MNQVLLSKNFSKKELECQCGCGMVPNQLLIDRLQQLRDVLGRPLKINSAARCAKHNSVIGGAKASKHVLGEAVDIGITSGNEGYTIVKEAMKLGFNGIGVAKTFIHLDVRTGTEVLWLY